MPYTVLSSLSINWKKDIAYKLVTIKRLLNGDRMNYYVYIYRNIVQSLDPVSHIYVLLLWSDRMPSLMGGFANYLLPVQVGAPDRN